MTNTNIEQAIQDLKDGKLIIVLDDLDRENEGDFLGLVDTMTHESVNFMITYGKGLLCAPISKEIAIKHNLSYMPKRESDGTNFLLSIDSPLSTTGISAKERMQTMRDLLSNKNIEFLSPGHIFPLLAIDGGLSKRRGHTEAAIDMAKLAGKREVGAIIEITKPDGEMARRDWLINFANKHKLTFITIDDLTKYIESNKKEIWDTKQVDEFKLSFPAPVPTLHGMLNMQVAKDTLNDKDYIIVYKGEIYNLDNPLLRVHSQCATSEVFGSLKCDCREQLNASLDIISKKGGIVIYTQDEGRGIGIFEKINAYHKQEVENMDTIEANLAIGHKPDERRYERVANLLKQLNISKIRLMTNNMNKIHSLKKLGIQTERVEHWIDANEKAQKYIKTKIEKMGHIK